ncbi:MAG: HEAT repeat domain-containing protein [Nitrospirota bacterium]
MGQYLILTVLTVMILFASISISTADNLFSKLMTASLTNSTQDTVKFQKLELSEVGLLLAALKSRDPFVRVNAVQGLGEAGDAEATERIIAALRDDNQYVRAYAAEALGQIKQSKAVEPLIAALNDEDEFVQVYVVRSLGEIGDSKALKPLIDLLNSEKQVVKIHAAWALGEIKDLKAVGALIAALKDEVCCDHAAEALKKITEQDFGTDYEQWNNWWLNDQ